MYQNIFRIGILRCVCHTRHSCSIRLLLRCAPPVLPRLHVPLPSPQTDRTFFFLSFSLSLSLSVTDGADGRRSHWNGMCMHPHWTARQEGQAGRREPPGVLLHSHRGSVTKRRDRGSTPILHRNITPALLHSCTRSREEEESRNARRYSAHGMQSECRRGANRIVQSSGEE